MLNIANKIQETTIETDSVVQYTTNYNFDYANQKISECHLWTRGNVLIPGVYSFEFIMQGQVIGIANAKVQIIYENYYLQYQWHSCCTKKRVR